MECVAEDATRAVISVFRLADGAEATYRLQARGLDLGRRYQVTLDNEGMVVEKSGEELHREGLSLTIGHALGSQLVLLQAV